MVKTRDQIAENILRELRVLASNQQINIEDANIVKGIYNTQLEALRSKQITHWDADSIPDDIYDDLTIYMAYFVAPRFGLPQDIAAKKESLREMKALVAKRKTGETTQSVYF